MPGTSVARPLDSAQSMPNRNPMAITMSREEESEAELAHALLQRLVTLKSIGAGGESFPLLLDDVLAEVDPRMKPELLELLMKASADQQVIYLTQDEDVASWARVEALTGAMSVVEPVSERTPAPIRRRPGIIAVDRALARKLAAGGLRHLARFGGAAPLRCARRNRTAGRPASGG